LAVWWIVASLWFFLLVPLIGMAYYSFVLSPEFDGVLKALMGRQQGPPESSAVVQATRDDTGDLVAGVQLGGYSSTTDGLSRFSTTIGLCAETPGAARRLSRLTKGELRATYQATYLGWFGARRFPNILVIVKDTRPDGRSEYEIHVLGLRWLSRLLALCVIGAGIGVPLLSAFGVLPGAKGRATYPQANSLEKR
jgi:hypothetical protein